MQQTLVLDQGYQPINAVPFQKALGYIVKGKVDVLASYERVVHPYWQMPAVVRLTHWVQTHQRKVKFSRQNVLIRDRFVCQYCGVSMNTGQLTFDHVQPRSRGGRTTWTNIVAACSECNSHKANRTPQEAGMKLRKRPVQPTWLPMYNMTLQRLQDVPSEWRDYWIVELVK
jgi:5-methylcytosine-specific restriction endonuclease McrA